MTRLGEEFPFVSISVCQEVIMIGVITITFFRPLSSLSHVLKVCNVVVFFERRWQEFFRGCT